MVPAQSTATALLSFAASYVAVGVVLAFFVWDPEGKALVRVGPPSAGTVVGLIMLAAFSTFAFGGGCGSDAVEPGPSLHRSP